MNKGKNCFFAILVFGLTMAVFNGMSVVLAVSASIGGGIIQGANGVNMTYDYLMDHMNFYSVLVYLIPLAIFGLWYYFAFVDQKGTENSLSVKIKKLDISNNVYELSAKEFEENPFKNIRKYIVLNGEYTGTVIAFPKGNSGILVQLDNSKVTTLCRVPARFNNYPHFKDKVLIKITEINENKKFIYSYLMRII